MLKIQNTDIFELLKLSSKLQIAAVRPIFEIENKFIHQSCLKEKIVLES